MKLFASLALVVWSLSVSTVVRAQLVEPAPNRATFAPPPAADTISQTAAARGKTAFLYSLAGTTIPLAMGVAVSMTLPSGTTAVPTWQWATLGTLFGVGLAWGPSLGYYQGGLPAYATLAGAAKSAMLTGAYYLDRRNSQGDTGGPVLTVLALFGVAAWDTFDLITVRRRVRNHYEEETRTVVPLAMPVQGGGMVGVAGMF